MLKAASLVKSGRSVSLAIPNNNVAGPDNPYPAIHYLIHNYDIDLPEGKPRFALDFLGSECHGDCHTHIYALCHISYKGKLYNDKPVSMVTSRGLKIAGLHVDTIPWMHERKISVFLPDGDGETVPCNVEGMAYPIHALQIAAMGMVCADSLQFEELVKICEEEKRWEFMVIATPLRLPGGTGTLFNPIAIF